MNISARTKTVALFGYPVRHSLSPVFQNAAFHAAGIDAIYLCYEVPPQQLKEAVRAIRTLNFLGANLTVPHKEMVIPFLNGVSSLARKIGSVNTIINKKGKLIGETTDGAGFLRSLKDELGITVKGKKVFLVGTGGAGRALAFSLVEAGSRVYLTNRTGEKAERLSLALNRSYPKVKTRTVPFGERKPFLQKEGIDLLINATSIGLKEKELGLFSGDDLPEDLVVCDLIYNRKTELLRTAEKRGLKTLNGLGMLIYQGAISFELWTGKTAPVQAMFDAVKNYGPSPIPSPLERED
ncbi:MAG: shikimate dehydrogenase [bacterium (Candidatus Ratteibacteria) CG23_combo_of_CG06-09_8_20_14_all_48_7]|uniref:Shikimate dehydrogenase (NADP(+)) n=1 Tax=bacterium (Candidatus Ratteibacteria) CG23_combo_of_CG06-09_8_20_14_all_48_7 TaxID=2014292 RepID=A0A2G9YA97_9BACT|nr:MAG: shikimate dehydrogenase [bacterium (Candidatus Ratteibacteria) CG23_combo_of_CG06-09_8_20_14_all_48_7]